MTTIMIHYRFAIRSGRLPALAKCKPRHPFPLVSSVLVVERESGVGPHTTAGLPGRWIRFPRIRKALYYL